MTDERKEKTKCVSLHMKWNLCGRTLFYFMQEGKKPFAKEKKDLQYNDARSSSCSGFSVMRRK